MLIIIRLFEQRIQRVQNEVKVIERLIQVKFAQNIEATCPSGKRA
jgi:hypothetical protein